MSEHQRKGRGGPRPGSGPKTADGARGMVRVNVSMQPAQHAKFRRLGGSVWLRQQIDAAEDPAPDSPKA